MKILFSTHFCFLSPGTSFWNTLYIRLRITLFMIHSKSTVNLRSGNIRLPKKTSWIRTKGNFLDYRGHNTRRYKGRIFFYSFFFDDNFLSLVLRIVSIWYSVWMEGIGDTSERKITKHDLFDAFLCLTHWERGFRDSYAPRSPLWRILRALAQCSLVIQISSTMHTKKRNRSLDSHWQMTDCPRFEIFHAWYSIIEIL